MSRNDHPRPSWNLDWLSQAVHDLPIEIEPRYPQQSFALAVRIDNLVFHVLATQMHVGHVVDQLHITSKGVSGRYLMAGSACGNFEEVIGYGQRNHSLFRRLPGKDQPKACAVSFGTMQRAMKTGVMDLKDDRRASA